MEYQRGKPERGRLTMVIEVEYDLIPARYPNMVDAVDYVAFDVDMIKRDPGMFARHMLGGGGGDRDARRLQVVTKVSGEVVKKGAVDEMVKADDPTLFD